MKNKDGKDNIKNVFLIPRFVCLKCGEKFLFESSLKRTKDNEMVCKKCLNKEEKRKAK